MPRGDKGLNDTSLATALPRLRLERVAAHVAYAAFALYLILLLGANSVVAAGGPLSWLPLWRWPVAGGSWEPLGIVSLLPLVSVAAWLLHRHQAGRLRALTWGWSYVVLPLALLTVVALASVAGSCLAGACEAGQLIRLLLLIGQGVWVYLYVMNEKPDLLWVLAVIITLQAGVALGQFLGQRDLGLRLLGEPALDPAVRGISVVMRGTERWLRGYGLTNHPNTTASTLVAALLMLPLTVGITRRRQIVAGVVFVLGVAGILSTLARWAIACLALALLIAGLPWLRAAVHGWRPSRRHLALLAALLLLGAVSLGIYGDAILGRMATNTPIESRSLWERERDTAIAGQLLAERPWSGVGLGNYVTVASERDAWAEVVHNVPLLLGAELGLAGVLLWGWLLLAPVFRRGAFSRYAPQTALWLGFWLLGLFYPAPHPFLELRSTLLTGLVVALSAPERARLTCPPPDARVR